MSTFEGNHIGKLKNSPEWWADFTKNYFFVIKYLLNISKNGLLFAQNQKHYTEQKTVSSGVQFKLNHSLGTVPTCVLIQGGRYRYYEIIEKTEKSITLSVELVSEQITDTEPIGNISSVEVANPSVFKEGDSVVVEFRRYKNFTRINRIEGHRIYLESFVAVNPPGILRLESELLNLIVY